MLSSEVRRCTRCVLFLQSCSCSITIYNSATALPLIDRVFQKLINPLYFLYEMKNWRRIDGRRPRTLPY